jgi:HD-GYP domain-containing protein (c-di-GMP phosphodiesterase class II)
LPAVTAPDHVVVARDLVDAHGTVLARRGFVITPALIEETARRAPAPARIALTETALMDDLRLPLADPPYRHLFRPAGAEAGVRRAFAAARLPGALIDELAAIKLVDGVRYRHALATAAITARLLQAAVGDVPAISELVVAALLHDIGMRHVSFHLVRNADELEPREVHDVAAHPLLGAWHIASILGPHPAVQAALAHHWKNGQGYPALPQAPMRAVELVSTASAFAALTQVRPFRPEPFDARGAIDVLVAEANMGQRDAETVRLLIHMLRGGRGEVRSVRFARARLGHSPTVNHHTRIDPQPEEPPEER